MLLIGPQHFRLASCTGYATAGLSRTFDERTLKSATLRSADFADYEQNRLQALR